LSQEEGLNEVLAAFGAPAEAPVRHPEEEILSKATGVGQASGTGEVGAASMQQSEAASAAPATLFGGDVDAADVRALAMPVQPM
jgi:hypothetical protein